MEMSNIYPLLQSAYRKQHSTETTLLKVMNNILLKRNSQHVTSLVTLNLHVSAAFDTVNHKILLKGYNTTLAFPEYPGNVQVMPVKQKLKNRSSRIII